MKAKRLHKNGASPKKRMPKWKRHLDEYPAKDLVLITFASEADIDAGTALIWGGKLTGAPFELDVNGPSFIVPKATLPHFSDAGIKFTSKPAFPEPAK